MLKEVGTSGQISLGKKFAGRLFDVVFCPDGRVELVPMKAVPTVQSDPNEAQACGAQNHSVQEEAVAYRVGDGWLTPERLALRKAAAERTAEELEIARSRWATENQAAIEAMNQRMAKIGSMGRRIHEWRKAKAEREPAQTEAQAVPAPGTHGSI